MDAPKWHGWKLSDGTALHIGRLPHRVHPVLYIAEMNEYSARVMPCASFRSQECAEAVMRLLDKMLRTEES